MSKVLLLEPDAQLGSTYQAALEYSGHDVARFADAQAAILGIDRDTPDVIVAELQLALHNGIEFLYELRSYAEWQQIPVIVLSNVPVVEKKLLDKLWNDLHIEAYHYKPLTKLHQIITTIENVLAPVA